MTGVKYNRKLAKVVMVILIIVSLVLGCYLSIGRLYNEVSDAYRENSAAYGQPLQDVAAYATYAQEVYDIALTYGMAEDEFLSAIEGLKQKGGSVTQLGPYITTIQNDAAIAYDKILASEDIPKYDREAAIMYMTSMDTVMMRLSENVIYARAADKYNEALDSFLPKLIMPKAEKAFIF